MLLLIPGVELKNQLARRRYPVVQIAVSMFGQWICTQQFRIPAAARSYIAHRDERLGLDG